MSSTDTISFALLNTELVRSLTAETDEMSTDKASRSASSNLAEPAPTESMGRNGGQSFDVMLSLLKPADGERWVQERVVTALSGPILNASPSRCTKCSKYGKVQFQ
eukprot:1160524-Pelagomonas_calceolata.AAC.11